jgi:hypothetical protein
VGEGVGVDAGAAVDGDGDGVSAGAAAPVSEGAGTGAGAAEGTVGTGGAEEIAGPGSVHVEDLSAHSRFPSILPAITDPVPDTWRVRPLGARTEWRSKGAPGHVEVLSFVLCCFRRSLVLPHPQPPSRYTLQCCLSNTLSQPSSPRPLPPPRVCGCS